MANDSRFRVDITDESKRVLNRWSKAAENIPSIKGGGGSGSGGMTFEQQLAIIRERFDKELDLNLAISDEQKLRSKFLVESRKEMELLKQRNWHNRNLIRNIDRLGTAFGQGDFRGGVTEMTKLFFKLGTQGLSKTLGIEKGEGQGIPIGFNDTEKNKKQSKLMAKIMGSKFGEQLKTIKDSKIGQALGSPTGKMAMGGLAGGGAGILGGVIMKAIEASPIAQAMLKMMSNAFTLILRPIGDFFGGFFKPISIRLLMWGAENVKNGTGMFKAGQEIAAHVIGFFSNPTAYIGNAIMDGVDHMYNGLVSLFVPIFAPWADVNQMLKPVEGLDGYLAEFRTEISDFEGMVTEASTQVRSGLTTEMLNDTNIIGGKLDELIEIAEKQLEEITPSAGGVGELPTQPEDEDPIEKHAKTHAEKFLEHISGHKGEMTPAMFEAYKISFAQKHQSAYFKGGNVKGETIEEVRSNIATRKEGSEALKESHQHMQAWNDSHNRILNSDIEEKRASLEKHNAQLLKVRQNENAARLNMQEEWLAGELTIVEHMNQQKMLQLSTEELMTKFTVETSKVTKVIKSNEVKIEFDILNMTKDLFAFAAKIYKDAVNSLNQLKAAQQAARRSSRGGRRSRAVGGMITEPVMGIGEWTGDIWTFGERGLEYVTPRSGGSSTNNYDQKSNIVVNVNVDKMASDLDLQKLKPIIERAIRETHSRRGII